LVPDLHPAHEEHQQTQEERERPPGHEELDIPGALIGWFDLDLNMLLSQHLDEIGIVRRIGVKSRVIFQYAANMMALNDDLLEVASVEFRHEVTENDLFL
jgi:hypothetical protein